MTDTPRRRTFQERERHQGWTGRLSACQPLVSDRLVSLTTRDRTQFVLGHPSRITQIDHSDTTTVYTLADGTVITAPTGARIHWEQA